MHRQFDNYISDNYITEPKSPLKTVTINEDNLYKIDPQKIQMLTTMVSDELHCDVIPKQTDIHISTIAATCKIKGLKFYCDNIAKYIDISSDSIEKVIKDSGHIKAPAENNIMIYRSICLKRDKHAKKRKRSFFNQVSICVKIKSKNTGYVHVKLFSNGSIQMAGCQKTQDIVETIVTIMQKMKTIKAVVENNVLKEKPFVNDINLVDLSGIYDFHISMVNTNFRVSFLLNLSKIHSLLVSQNIDSRFERISGSCVHIKYNHPIKKITILLFEKGSIVITGVKNGDQILAAYNFINKFLYANYQQIIKTEIQSQNILDFTKSS